MRKKRFSVEQMVGIMKHAEVGVPIGELVRPRGDFRADILAVEEAVREAGERCKPTFIAGKNMVEHQEQFQGWAGKWL